MNKFSEVLFNTMPVVGIVRHLSLAQLSEVLPAYYESGLTSIEITMNTAGAAEMINYAANFYAGKLNVGAGTVCSMDDLDIALKAGAQFIVTPVIVRDVVSSCVQQDVPVMTGAFTPTEIFDAWKMGSFMVKVYPAASLGPPYISDIKAPLDKIKLLPTGGITLTNMRAFRDAGADGLGIGGSLFDKEIIGSGDQDLVKMHFKKFADLMH